MSKLTDWLETFEHISTVTPMTIEIQGKIYEAASYVAKFNTTESCDAYRRGERTYWQSFIYVLGELPACYRRSSHVAFTIAGDPSEWYVACYWPGLIYRKQLSDATPTEYQPFGPNFMLSPWNTADGKAIDYYEDKSYKRVLLTVMKEDLALVPVE